ncbi:MAG: alpha-glucosidase [Clostridiales bacterium]|nr:alpha-glucosidase [Clostridiales bacterium]
MEPIRFGEYAFERTAAGFRLLVRSRELLRCEARFLAGLRTRMRPIFAYGNINLRRKVLSARYAQPDFTVSALPDGVELSGALADKVKTPWRMRFSARPEGLAMSLELSGYDELRFSFAGLDGESFYGFGEQFTHLDMRGRRFRLCTAEQGIGRGAQPISALVNLVSPGASGDDFTTYVPMPVFVTSEKRAFSFDQSTIYHFDVCRRDRRLVTMDAVSDRISGWLFQADTPLALIERHTAVTGRLSPLPEFAYGAILGLRGGKDAAEAVIAACEQHGAQIAALWIEDWQGRRGKNGGPPLWWRWFPDEALYPDFVNWSRELKRRGIALLGYANPMLSLSEENPLYLEGRDKGYFIRHEDGSDYEIQYFNGPEYRSVMVDLTNPEAYGWLKEKMRAGMVEAGLSGWMADYAEYVPLDSVSREKNAVLAHCDTPVLWQKLNRALIEETGRKEDFLLFSRSGGTGGNRTAVCYWTGDQTPTFDRHDGLASSITGILTGGCSGMSINHTDIGGFTTVITPIYKLVRTKDVMFRWLEYAAFTPIFRTHDGSFSSDLVYQFYREEEGLRFFARMSRLHDSLRWYFRLLEQEACGRGLPMMRALWLHYPEDAACRRISHQYLLGEDLLVCPVTKKNAASIRVYLPQGDWEHAFTGERFDGGQWRAVPCPCGTPAAFLRLGGPHTNELRRSIRAASNL